LLEGFAGVLLESLYYIGKIIFGVNIADFHVRIRRKYRIADGVDKMGLAESYSTIDKQRVIGDSGIHGDLLGRGAGQIICSPRYQCIESEIGVQPGPLVRRITALDRLGYQCDFVGCLLYLDFRCRRDFDRRFGNSETDGNRSRKEIESE
jgi:hypothetical protein